MKNVIILFLSIFIFSGIAHAKDYTVKSPDGKISLNVTVGKTISWSVDFSQKPLILPGEISMKVNDNELGVDSRLSKKSIKTIKTSYEAVVAVKSKIIEDYCNELILKFKGNFELYFRVYNDGIAYRFATSYKEKIKIFDEKSEIKFAGNYRVLFPEEESFISHYERMYKDTSISSISTKQLCSLPVLIQSENNINVAVTETDLYDYPCMFMFGTGENSFTAGFPKAVLKTEDINDRSEKIIKEADYIAETAGKRTFPWRIFIITDSDEKLVESQMVDKLARPLAIEDASWIKPGKVAWDWWNANNIYGVDFQSGINTKTYKYYIDFASKYGVEYIILDEGWAKSSTNIIESNPNIDLKELIDYGKSKNVGIILWTLWKPLEKNMEEIMDFYHKIGVKGVKVDFMTRADQYMVNYYERVAKEAAKHHLLVDFHGAFKPSGHIRAYPNVLSHEGVQGLEHNKWSEDETPEHDVTLPFTRMIAGPMDYTPGAMINAQKDNFIDIFSRPMSQGTRCHQVAMYVIYESPLQMMADNPSNYLKEAETTSFIASIPVTWDETKVLKAQVADYIVIARRKGVNWYIGAMTDWNEREIAIDLSFLPDGEYKMKIMQDGINANRYASDYKKMVKTVDKKAKITIKMARGGGWCAILNKN